MKIEEKNINQNNLFFLNLTCTIIYRSLAVKAQYVLDHNLGGVSVWTVDFGDFKGICGPTYPLLKAIKHILKG